MGFGGHEILDVKADRVTGVRINNPKTDQEQTVDCAGVFVAIGHVPNTGLFRGVLEMDAGGYLVPRRGAASTCRASLRRGDCADPVYRQRDHRGRFGMRGGDRSGARYLAGL